MSTTRFYKLPADLAARSDLPGNAKVLLAVIADKIGGNAAAWPGARKLARAAGVSVEAVIQNVVKLEAAGLLAVERRDNGRSNRYTLPDTQPNGAESAQEGSALSEAPKKAERPRKPNTGAQESGALAPKKAERI